MRGSKSLTGGFICVMPTTLAIALSAVIILASASGNSSPSCSKRTTPKFDSSASSPHCLSTTASLVVRSAACWRVLAFLLLRRHRIVDTICMRYGLMRMPSA